MLFFAQNKMDLGYIVFINSSFICILLLLEIVNLYALQPKTLFTNISLYFFIFCLHNCLIHGNYTENILEMFNDCSMGKKNENFINFKILKTPIIS